MCEGDVAGFPGPPRRSNERFVWSERRVPDGPRDFGEPDMPVHRGKDSDGPFYQWGDSGKKYHYESGDESSRKKAKGKAERQGKAARASGYRG